MKTAEEIERIQVAQSEPRFVDAEMLSVDFLSDPAAIERLLPPPLAPGDTPRVTAMVGRWRSNCVADFDGGAIYVSATFGDLAGDYVLAMWMDDDQPMIYGREMFGEPKKLARSQLYRSGDHFSATITRHGVDLLALEADLDIDHGPGRAAGINFNFKSRPATDGIGLEEDAILTVAEFNNVLRVSRSGSGTVALTGTVHDPLDELPVVEVIGARFIEGDLHASARSVATVPMADFLPYALGRVDDWSLLNTEGSPRILTS
ncbi:acetoacetate decarboxylase family protein [Aeromicrobium wangtongii]|uniref:Acetoacetate decarboxylase family protein n=1 Tax=Aeromicrobium wangtongii TaxID=2969247 RepID=A0ABY5MD92_9ACTN|nr:acetoacetate decarboxylase family protein [Aeromicrobium wangtongii]MCD9197705.1 acetoacetate decarboxylase family protein [Aeromicrobium wangtongii]UUP15189.1 acetoacetate decarboxylase family protein [Aeromicrobium wangtongii]